MGKSKKEETKKEETKKKEVIIFKSGEKTYVKQGAILIDITSKPM